MFIGSRAILKDFGAVALGRATTEKDATKAAVLVGWEASEAEALAGKGAAETADLYGQGGFQ